MMMRTVYRDAPVCGRPGMSLVLLKFHLEGGVHIMRFFHGSKQKKIG
jgi:hypothetical protein